MAAIDRPAKSNYPEAKAMSIDNNAMMMAMHSDQTPGSAFAERGAININVPARFNEDGEE